MVSGKWKSPCNVDPQATRVAAICVCLVTVGVALLPAERLAAEQTVRFNEHIRPILSQKCFACHGFDAKVRQADLRLDIAEGAYADREGVRAVVPGDLSASELWIRIASDDPDTQMPPPDSNKILSPAEKDLIRRWIEQGAPYQKHWAFEAPSPPTLPAGSEGNNPIDALIDDRLQHEGLQRLPPADRSTLIRRVAFTLTGLPPSPQEVDRYLHDRQPGAFERMVDRYLASPHYGEEMARHWLDVARYADTHGMHLDNERQTWAYRDWVVKSFNRNQPFDQFTIDQLAGDLYETPTQDQLVATGFNRCNVTTSEGGSIDDELIFRYAVDRTSTMVQAWMGLTAGCAVCHDHKFDPISQREFYSLYAFFHSAADPAMDGNALLTNPILKLETSAAQAQLARFAEQIAEKQRHLEQTASQLDYKDPALSPGAPQVATETVWMDDEFPANGKLRAGPGHPTSFVSKDDSQPVLTGNRSLKRTDNGLSQDIWEESSVPLAIPQGGTIFAHVWIDANHPPQAIMLQCYKDGWKHRAVWGDYEVIPYGTAFTTERVHMGPIPAAGSWQRLEIPVHKIGLADKDMITGFALTQHGGTVYWDKVGVSGIDDPAVDPARSFVAWWRSAEGKDTAGLSAELNAIAKQGPNKCSNPDDERRLRLHYVKSICTTTMSQLAPIADELKKLVEARDQFDNSIPRTFIFKNLEKPRDSFVMLRGAYDKPGEKVTPNVPAVLPALGIVDKSAYPTRMDLARWLVTPEHPLTARVAVNRFWQQVFGSGLVKTSYDFGSQGEPPSHPELLDWLALEFRASGWNVKQLMWLMVTSETFQQQSRTTPETYAKDPHNRLYARGARIRLDAEQIRDNGLFVSGLLVPEQGGKGVRTYQPPNIWEPVGFAGSNTRFYTQDQGSALYRRSLYTFLKRTAPPPFMANFDGPNREQFCTRRERSNTPLQALQLMNDVQHVEAARMLAQRMMTEGGSDLPARLAFGYRTVLARAPESEEVAIIEQEYTAHFARYTQDPESAQRLIRHGESVPRTDLAPAELAAYTLVANMILNLDETLNRN